MKQEKLNDIQNDNSVKINKLLTDVLELSEEVDLEHIKQNIFPITKKIENDFKTIEAVYLKNSMELSYDKVLLKLLTWFTIGEKMFARVLYLNQKVNIANSDLEEYSYSFANYTEELRYYISNIFNEFVNLVKESKNYKQIRYVYSFYQTFIINVLYLLPENYRNEVLATSNFIDTKKIIDTLNYSIDLKNIDFKAFYKHMYETMLIDFINNNYGVNLFNPSSTNKYRTRKLNNE